MLSTTTAASASSRTLTSAAMVSDEMSGQSPDKTTSDPSKSASASAQTATAPAVPFCCSCTTISVSPSTSGATCSRACPTTLTTRSTPASRAASTTHRTSGLPSTSCATFGFLDFMRVPAPAASTIAAVLIKGPLDFRRALFSKAREHCVSVRSSIAQRGFPSADTGERGRERTKQAARKADPRSRTARARMRFKAQPAQATASHAPSRADQASKRFKSSELETTETLRTPSPRRQAQARVCRRPRAGS